MKRAMLLCIALASALPYAQAADAKQAEDTKAAAEAKAKRETPAQAAAKRAAETRAKREAEMKARREAEAKARAEAKERAEREARERKAKIDELRGRIDKCSSRSCWNDWFARKWTTNRESMEPLPQAQLDAITDEYISTLEQLLELMPDDAATQLEYGNALLFRKRYDKAEKVYRKVEAQQLARVGAERARGRLDAFALAEAEYRIANVRFALGDREGAIAMLGTLRSRPLTTVARGRPNWMQYAATAHDFLSGATPFTLGLPLHTGARPFPEAQEAKFTDKFAPLGSVAVELSGVAKDDARVRLLLGKLNARGIDAAVGKGDYRVSLVLDANAPVDRKEGYTLRIGEKGAEVRARDLQGILWGVVSFVQCLSDGERSVRVCEVNDWPDCARRGFLCSPVWSGTAEFVLFCKMNSVVVQSHPLSAGDDAPLNVYQCASLTRDFRDFGLEIYFGISNYTMGLGSTWAAYRYPSTKAMRIERCRLFASFGAGVYYPNDDMRYPEHKDDLAIGLHASDGDARHVLDVYNAVKAEYPAFRMIYCPPFYWGPDSAAPYPDDREKYLKSLRILPPELVIYWTGGQVKGYNKSKRQVDWFTNLTGHRPVIFQNGTGPHNLLSYIVDETDWNAWHYPGFFENDIAAFHKNSGVPGECPQITTLADCLWNVKGYDMRRSVERGVNMILGEKMYSILSPGLDALASFDKYKYGYLNADILHEDLDDLRRRYELASNCWAKALAYNPKVQWYGAFGRGVGFAEKVLKAARNPPDFLAGYRDLIPPARELAEKETGFDKSRGDLMYLPTDMSGPDMFFYRHSNIKEFRFAKFIRGTQTHLCATELRFECDPFPPAGDYELVLRGMDDEVEGLNPIEVSVNDKVIFSGLPGFVPAVYTNVVIRIPFDSMARYNKLRIKNMAYGANPNGPPYLAIAYAMLRKTGEKPGK